MALCSNKAKGIVQQLVVLRQQLRFHGSDSAAAASVLASRLQLSDNQPTVLANNGKWARVTGQRKPVMNFTSKDVFGVQNHPALDQAEKDPNLSNRISLRPAYFNQHSADASCQDCSAETRQHLSETLALLHGKDDVILSSASFGAMVTSWLAGILKQDGGVKVHVYRNCHWIEGLESEKVLSFYSDIEELESQLSSRRQSASTASPVYVLVEADATKASVDQLRRLCNACERHYATAVLLDPQAIGLIRHAMGEEKEVLRILRRPPVVLTSLDLLSGNNGGCYLAGSRKHVTQAQQQVPEESLRHSERALRRTIKALTLLPDHSVNVLAVLMHALSLRIQLQEASLRVRESGLSLALPLRDEALAQNVHKALTEKGFLTELVNGTNQPELHFSVSGHHTGQDVINFRLALIQCLNTASSLATDSKMASDFNMAAAAAASIRNAFPPLPAISLASLDRQQGELHRVTSYTELLQAERAQQRKLNLTSAGAAENNQSEWPKSTGNESAESQCVCRPMTKDHAVKYTAVRDSASQSVQLQEPEADMRHFLDVYFRGVDERDADDNARVFNNVMWASMQDEDESQGENNNKDTAALAPRQALKQALRLNVSKSVRQPGDMKFLEHLYCTPMFSADNDIFIQGHQH